ncbi:hypothetical protein P3S68_030848 [Capsicum galapagoense]
MAKNLETDDVLFSKEKSNKKNTSTWNKNKEKEITTEKGGNSHNNKKCYRCGKIENIKKNCRVKLSKANVACTNDGDEQMKWEQCFSSETVEQKSAEDFVNYDNNNKREEWIVDSRCSHHVTGDDSLFSEMREHHRDRVIIITDNSTYPVSKEGVVTIEVADDKSKSIKLQDVYHVLGLKKNLVSVPQITDSGKYVLFGLTDVKVLENVKETSADIIFTDERKGSLFVMSTGEAYVKKTSQTDSAKIWHARLGHVGYQMLQQISSRKLVDGMPTLKNVREDVIYLMVPIRTPSYSGHRYVMVLVDDHSRFTWVKFLKENREALSKFVEFKNVVANEFRKKIKCLRSDNGGEYMSDDFFQYCHDNRILCQMTCPDTPQQNGVAERKFAYLTSVCLSSLHDKNLPRELWAKLFNVDAM